MKKRFSPKGRCSPGGWPIFLLSGVGLWRKGEGHSKKGWLVMESKKGVKAPEKLWIIGFLLHFFLKFRIRILIADAIVYFQVVLYVREMPLYELLLKIFLCDPAWP